MTDVPAIFVNDLGRSQIRRTIFQALLRIQPENRPDNSNRNFGTAVQLVTDAWVTPEEVTDLPAVQLRFSRTNYHSRQSETLNAQLFFQLRCIVGLDDWTDESLLGARLDLLMDDVIAAMYSNYRAAGFAYEVSLLEDFEEEPIEGGKRSAVMHWQMHYTRSYGLDAREGGDDPIPDPSDSFRCALASPVASAQVTGEQVIAMWALSELGLDRAELFINDIRVKEWPPNDAPNSAQPPLPVGPRSNPSRTNFRYVWDTSTSALGNARLRFVAFEPNGAMCDASVTVEVT